MTQNPILHADDDGSRRFLFEQADIRGETVHLDAALREALALHQYAPAVRALLGEFLAASVLLSSTLKFEGKLTLQARSSGQIPLIMAECSSERTIRAIARGAEHAIASEFSSLLRDGTLTITIDPHQGQRYQGIVPLLPQSLSASLEAYFSQSEQLGTRVWLASDGDCAGGLLLQQLPPDRKPDPAAREADWQHACALAATISEHELLHTDTETLVHRLYHEELLRLYPGRALRFACSCSNERTLNALSGLDPAELEDILQEQGNITMDCEFCNQQYIYQREDIAHLLPQHPEQTLH